MSLQNLFNLGKKYKKFFILKLLFLLVVTLSESQVKGSQQQSLRFFKEQDCLDGNGTLGTIYDTGNLTETLGTALSFSINGFWRMDYCGPSVLGPGGCKINIWKYEDTCSSRVSNLNYNFTYVERLGNEFQNGTEIVFFSETNFKGHSYRSDGCSLNFNIPDTVKSWFFTGNFEWTIYSGANYTGVKTCLQPNDLTVSRGYGFNYNLNDMRTIGSVSFTCLETGPAPTSTAPSMMEAYGSAPRFQYNLALSSGVVAVVLTIDLTRLLFN